MRAVRYHGNRDVRVDDIPEPEVVPEPVVDLGPELGSEAPEVARVPPPKPEVALEDLKGWLADTSPEAVSTPRTRALRKEDEPTA